VIQLNERVTLIETTEAVTNGKIVRAETGEKRTVFAHIGSIGMREFYDSAQAGFELACKITLWGVDYKQEREIEFRGDRYHVERTYETPAGMVELTCTKAKGRG